MGYEILIIDDNDAFREVLSDFFESYEYKVTQAPSAIIALDLLNHKKFECIIVDVLMPKMNGLEFTQKVFNSSKPIPVAIMSGYSDHVNFDEVKKSPYLVGFYPKPFNETKLITDIQNKISANRGLSI